MNDPKNNQGCVAALCVSREKHTAKHSVASAFLKKDFGIEGDAHAGNTHRQVSLLSEKAIARMKKAGAVVSAGSFGENMIVRDLAVDNVKVGDRLKIGPTAMIEITQLGKECHAPCAISRAAGFCIMPQEGVFARVAASGVVKALDPVILVDSF